MAVAKQIHIIPAIPSCLGGSREAEKYSDYDDDDGDTHKMMMVLVTMMMVLMTIR